VRDLGIDQFRNCPPRCAKGSPGGTDKTLDIALILAWLEKNPEPHMREVKIVSHGTTSM
jgi:hypothetical protein